jgi:hypothetical protein
MMSAECGMKEKQFMLRFCFSVRIPHASFFICVHLRLLPLGKLVARFTHPLQ